MKEVHRYLYYRRGRTGKVPPGAGCESRLASEFPKLLVEGQDCTLEHPAVGSGRRTTEILGGAGACELECAALLEPDPLHFGERCHPLTLAERLFLFSFD